MNYLGIFQKGGYFSMNQNYFQIEIRGRIATTAQRLPEYSTIVRYEVIAASLEEATDLVREYENSGRREHQLVKCTMRLA